MERSITKPGPAGPPQTPPVYTFDALEPRRLLAAASFGPPVVTPMPQGFQLAGVLTPFNDNGSVHDHAIALSATGGGLYLSSRSDGGFNVEQTLSTSGTIIAFDEEIVGTTYAAVVYTTAGPMFQMPNGSFTAPTGPSVPPDYVPKTLTVFYLPNQPRGRVLFERFVPDSPGAAQGTLMLGEMPLATSDNFAGEYGTEVDTVIATGAPNPGQGSPIPIDLVGGVVLPVAAAGRIWLGQSDGTFQAGPLLNLPPGAENASLYKAQLTGIGSPDLIAYPYRPPGAAGNEALVLVSTDGQTYHPGRVVDFASVGTTSDTLLVGDFAPDGTPDLLTDVTAGPSGTGVAIAAGLGNGTFLPPTLVSSSNFVPVSSYDMFLNGKPEVIGYSTQTNSLYTLVNTSETGPIIQLTSSTNPSVQGQGVVLTALVSNAVGGSLTFFDGTNVLGTATVQQDGRANFVTKTLSAGSHSLTVSFNPFASAPLTQVVNAAPASSPLVGVTSLVATSKASLVPGDKVSVRMTLSNLGGVAASGSLQLQFYLIGGGDISTPAAAVSIPSLQNLPVRLGPDQSLNLSSTFTVPPTAPAGSDRLVARIVQTTGLTPPEVLGTPMAAVSPMAVLWQFGDVDRRHNVRMVEDLGNRDVVNFSLTGPGNGTVTRGDSVLTLGSGSPDFEVVISGSTPATHVAITQTGGTASNIVSLTFGQGGYQLGTLDLRQDTPHSISMTTPGISLPIGKLLIGTLPLAGKKSNASASGSVPLDVPGDVTLSGAVRFFSADQINHGSVSLGSDPSTKFTTVQVGKLAAGFGLSSATPLASVKVGSAEAGSFLNVPAIGKLVSPGDFDANLTLSGVPSSKTVLASLSIGGSVTAPAEGQARWAFNGNAGTVSIAGNVTGLQLLGGASLATSGSLASPSTFSGTAIASVRIRGSVHASLLAAGLNPTDGVLLNGNDVLLAGGTFGSILIGGQLDAQSKILAASLPVTVSIAGQTVATSGDPQFKL